MKIPGTSSTVSAGAMHMFAATFYFAIMNVCIKLVGHLPVMEIVFFRCGISTLLSVVALRGTGVDWKGSNRKLLILRGLFGTAALYTYFITLTHMPLGTAVTIQYLSPIFTTLLAVFVLHEPVKPIRWLFFIFSFCGVLVMKGLDERIDTTYLLIGLGSSILSAFAYNTVRTLKEREHPVVVVLHFQLIGTITGFIFSLGNFDMPRGMDWFYLLLVGIFTQLGQVSLTKALQQEKIANVSIINYIGVLYAIGFGYFIFHEHYGAGTILGILMVIIGVVLGIIFR